MRIENINAAVVCFGLIFASFAVTSPVGGWVSGFDVLQKGGRFLLYFTTLFGGGCLIEVSLLKLNNILFDQFNGACLVDM